MWSRAPHQPWIPECEEGNQTLTWRTPILLSLPHPQGLLHQGAFHGLFCG